jgi:hypothetical protein
MDRPPGGWGDLVTNHTLDLRFAAWEERFATSEQRFDHKLDALESRMDLRLAGVEHKMDLMRSDLLAQVDRRMRSQAWMSISAIVAVGAVIVAAIRV